MNQQAKKESAKVFAAAFAESFAASLADAIGSPCALDVMDSGEIPTSKDAPIHFRLTVEKTVSGDCFIELYESQVRTLVSQILKEPVEEITDRHVELLTKTISAATAKMSDALYDQFGPLSFKVSRVSGLAFGGMLVIPIAARDAGADLQVLLYFGGQLLDALSAGPDGGSAKEGDRSAIAPNNLKMVLDVELNVSLRFGQRQMPLRDVLDLASGSVIELDRLVDEPVELFLDGKLIARGEAVIVDGNYGLRVTEIPQPLTSQFLN